MSQALTHEQKLRQSLMDLHRSYQQAAEPYLRQLAAIESLKPPRSLQWALDAHASAHPPEQEVKPAPPGMVLVTRDALRQVLQAIAGPGHLIRELQATRGIAALTGQPNPIEQLISDLNA